jgi:hypothetical protein
MLEWIYRMMNAIASKRCNAAKAWEPTIRDAIRSLKQSSSVIASGARRLVKTIRVRTAPIERNSDKRCVLCTKPLLNGNICQPCAAKISY